MFLDIASGRFRGDDSFLKLHVLKGCFTFWQRACRVKYGKWWRRLTVLQGDIANFASAHAARSAAVDGGGGGDTMQFNQPI